MPTKTSDKNPETDIAPVESKILLQSLRLSNFLSFGNAPEIKFGPLNVLIGSNGAGKSNLIEAITILRACPVSPALRGSGSIQSIMSAGGGVDEWIAKDKPKEPATLDVAISDPYGDFPLRHVLSFMSELGRFRVQEETIEDAQPYPESKAVVIHYEYNFQTHDHAAEKALKELNEIFEILPAHVKGETIEPYASILAQRNDPERFPQITHLIRQYSKIAIYRDWTFGKDTVYRQPQKADGRVDRLEEDFSNLGLFLNRLYGVPKTKRDLLSHLRDLYAEVDDLHIEIFAGNVQIVFNEGDFRIPATRLSDGTLRYLCLLAILCDPTPPPLICIEEPELGLHPDLLPKIADLLIEASTRTQLIVTTHSTILVDAMTERPECVLVCEKHDGQTQMTRLSQNDLAQWMGKYRLGELWTRGEIGGNRW